MDSVIRLIPVILFYIPQATIILVLNVKFIFYIYIENKQLNSKIKKFSLYFGLHVSSIVDFHYLCLFIDSKLY